MTHELKIFPWYFIPIVTGQKRFELRKNDRDYQVDDILILREWDPAQKRYTGYYVETVVTYVLSLSEFLQLEDNYIILSIKKQC